MSCRSGSLSGGFVRPASSSGTAPRVSNMISCVFDRLPCDGACSRDGKPFNPHQDPRMPRRRQPATYWTRARGRRRYPPRSIADRQGRQSPADHPQSISLPQDARTWCSLSSIRILLLSKRKIFGEFDVVDGGTALRIFHPHRAQDQITLPPRQFHPFAAACKGIGTAHP